MDLMFEKASRVKLRFTTGKGLLAVEDLWSLSLTSLSTIAKAIAKALKEEEEDFLLPVNTSNNSDVQLQKLRLELLKHIITTKLEEQEAAKTKVERDAQIAQIKDLMAQKQIESMSSMSMEELSQALKTLSNS